MKYKIIFLIFGILLLSFVSADIISINSGGDTNIGINSNFYVGGFSFIEGTCIPLTCSDLGYNCNSYSNGCGGTLNCGSCSSGYTCSSGVCIASSVSPGEGTIIQTPSIIVSPKEINLNLAVNTNKKEIIQITNNGTSSQTLQISQTGLNNIVIFGENSLTLVAGETKNLEITFVASDQIGIYTGKIWIGSTQVLVSLNVKTKLLLFDSNIIVMNDNYQIARGKKLKTQVELIPMGDEERMDVTLNYVIKDYNNNTYLTQSETVLVEDKINFKRNFDTGMLPIGEYIIGLELVYPGGVAPSSAYFEIVQTTPRDFLALLMFALIVSIVIVAIIITLLTIRRRNYLMSKKGR